MRHLIPFNVLVNVYNSLVQPHFDYCKVVWGHCKKGLSEKLERLQNRTARLRATIVIWMMCYGY